MVLTCAVPAAPGDEADVVAQRLQAEGAVEVGTGAWAGAPLLLKVHAARRHLHEALDHRQHPVAGQLALQQQHGHSATWSLCNINTRRHLHEALDHRQHPVAGQLALQQQHGHSATWSLCNNNMVTLQHGHSVTTTWSLCNMVALQH